MDSALSPSVGHRYHAAAAVLLALGFVGACEGSARDAPPDGSPDGQAVECWLPTADVEDDVREAAFRRLMLQEELSPIQVFFLGISHGEELDLNTRGATPSSEFMKRFESQDPPVLVEAAARYDDAGGGAVSDPDGLGPGAVLRVGTLYWSSRDSVRVDGSYYLANSAGAGFRLFLERNQSGGWDVVTIERIWNA